MMSEEELLKRVYTSAVDLCPDELRAAINEALESKVYVIKIIDMIAKASLKLAELYDKAEVGLPDVLLEGILIKRSLNTLKPYIPKTKPKGKIVIGTIQGNKMDIGKNLVATMLTIAGYEVHDLGSEVTPEKFIEGIKAVVPDIVGMSAVEISKCYINMKQVVDELKRGGTREKVKIMIGGTSTGPEYFAPIGIDAHCVDFIEAIKAADKFMALIKNH